VPEVVEGEVTRLLARLRFGVRTIDPPTLLTVAASQASVGALACYLPARPAIKVDSLMVLRCE
jgi:hypothetical protein